MITLDTESLEIIKSKNTRLNLQREIMLPFMEVAKLQVSWYSSKFRTERFEIFSTSFFNGDLIGFFSEGGKGVYFNAFELHKLEEKNQGDHIRRVFRLILAR